MEPIRSRSDDANILSDPAAIHSAALAQRPSGRPELPAEDPEKLALEKKLKRQEAENLKLQNQLELMIIVQMMLTEDLEDKKKEE